MIKKSILLCTFGCVLSIQSSDPSPKSTHTNRTVSFTYPDSDKPVPTLERANQQARQQAIRAALREKTRRQANLNHQNQDYCEPCSFFSCHYFWLYFLRRCCSGCCNDD